MSGTVRKVMKDHVYSDYSRSEQARATILKGCRSTMSRSQSCGGRIAALFGKPLTPVQAVKQILEDVQKFGDRALRGYTQQLDGVTVADLRVSEAELEQGWDETPQSRASRCNCCGADPELSSGAESASGRSWVERRAWRTRPGGSGPAARGRIRPGGSASYPSSVLMAAIPARVAGVRQVYVTTPPNRTGKVAPAILAAARIAEVDAVSGRRRTGMLRWPWHAHGPSVDKIVGPGNLFVVLAKRELYGQVGIDGLPGPTETLIVADEAARPQWVAADLIAQAEHDVLASAILLTPSSSLALQVQAEVTKQLADLPRQDIALQSLRQRGGIVLTESLAQALQLANAYAPEHLCLVVEDPLKWLNQVENAGGVFRGEMASEALGDYVVGPSHIKPTGGTARFSSAVNVLDFVKVMNVFGIAAEEVQDISSAAAEIADWEGLDGHARAVRYRVGG